MPESYLNKVSDSTILKIKNIIKRKIDNNNNINIHQTKFENENEFVLPRNNNSTTTISNNLQNDTEQQTSCFLFEYFDQEINEYLLSLYQLHGPVLLTALDIVDRNTCNGCIVVFNKLEN